VGGRQSAVADEGCALLLPTADRRLPLYRR